MQKNNLTKVIRIEGETYFGAPKALAVWIHENNASKLRISIGGNTSRTKNSQVVVDIEQMKSAIAQLENQER